MNFLNVILRLKILLCLIVISLHHFAEARIRLPHALTGSDRLSTLEFLAPTSSARLLSSPYPLGGWSGFEIGVSRQNAPLSYLKDLGDKGGTTSDLSYTTITLGKGLYYDLDLYLSFVPMTQTDSISHSSGQLRYLFWTSENRVFRVSGLLSASTSNVNDQISLRSVGYDLIGTTTIDKVSLFVGLGLLKARARFIGGAKGITDSQKTEEEDADIPHQLIGIEWPLGHFFWAAEVDRYKVPNYSLQLGYRL